MMDSSPSTQPGATAAQTIALFGLGPTGQAFCRYAMDAGYHVRALVQPHESQVALAPQVETVQGSLQENDALRAVLQRADYVVCLLNNHYYETYIPNTLLDFCRRMYPLMMEEPWIQVFFFQVST